MSFAFEHGYAAMQALIVRNVVGDFRAPDLMRFGFTPLYLDEGDIHKAVLTLEHVLNQQSWDRPEFCIRAAVT